MSIVEPARSPTRACSTSSPAPARSGSRRVSRGAAVADLVEIAPPSLRAIQRNVETLGAGDAVRVHRTDALQLRRRTRARTPTTSPSPIRRTISGLPPRSPSDGSPFPSPHMLGIEHRRDERLPGDGDRRQYGQTAITFFRRR